MNRLDHGSCDDPGRQDPTEPQGLDADLLLEELESLYRVVDERRVPPPFELYHRGSVTLRVRRDRGRAGTETRVGREEGTALRACSEPDRRVVFAAASGAGTGCLDWLADRVRRGHGTAPVGAAAWDTRPGLLIDRDPRPDLPTEDQLLAWLDRASSSLRVTTRWAWVEVATTVETWVATGGCRASRTRTRAWASAHPVRDGATPLTIAARRWEELPREGWAALRADRTWPRGRPGRQPEGALPVLFSPETSATLVSALVRVVHGSEAELGRPVGPAWRVEDVPLAEAALLGGLFDDGRFSTGRRELADGEEVVGVVEGPGHLRRASFRDPPAAVPAQLVLAPAAGGLPPKGVLVSSLRLHPLGPDDWMLQCEGGTLERGEPGPQVQGTIRVAPTELVRRCVATLGEPCASHRGVTTPALLFDALPWAGG